MEHSHSTLKIPTLSTERLLLRPFRFSDANDVQQLAGDRELAANTLLVPHPYEDGMAEAWIETHEAMFADGTNLDLAIVHRKSDTFVGAIGLGFQWAHQAAELGYWIGKPYWGQGYCTEAARALLRYGFQERNLHRIHAKHYLKNPASGRVLEKLGMKREGVLRDHILKWGIFEDTAVYGILRPEILTES